MSTYSKLLACRGIKVAITCELSSFNKKLINRKVHCPFSTFTIPLGVLCHIMLLFLVLDSLPSHCFGIHDYYETLSVRRNYLEGIKS